MPVCCNHNLIRLGNRLTSSAVSFGAPNSWIPFTLVGNERAWTLEQRDSSMVSNIVFLLKSSTVTPLHSPKEKR